MLILLVFGFLFFAYPFAFRALLFPHVSLLLRFPLLFLNRLGVQKRYIGWHGEGVAIISMSSFIVSNHQPT